MRERGWGVKWGCGGASAVQPHSMGGVRGGEEGHTQEHAQERRRECCTYPLATYPLKSARILSTFRFSGLSNDLPVTTLGKGFFAVFQRSFSRKVWFRFRFLKMVPMVPVSGSGSVPVLLCK